MTRTSRGLLPRRRLVLLPVVVVTLAVVAACSPQSGGPSLTSVTTGPSEPGGRTSGSASPSAPVTAPPISESPGGGSTPPGASSAGSAPSHLVPTPTAAAAAVTITPADGAADVSPVAPITVTASTGILRSVSLVNSDGQQIAGTLTADRTSWSSAPELGYGKQYTITASAVNSAGAVSRHVSTFATLTPDNQTAVAASFPRDGMKVGVGQPVSITFDEPITDRAAAQRLITVTSSPKQPGAFRWFSDREVHWRPQSYWTAGTTVQVEVKIYGRDLGAGLYGQADRAFSFTVGRSMIAEVDDGNKQMVIKRDGVVVRTMPVSLGQNKYPTYNGVHVVAEKYSEKIMDSSTWGLTGVGAYRTKVQWATRISSTGEFVHAAPWSVQQQGFENVSHGCVNVSTENAKWFHDNFTFGDIVTIKNTVGTDLEVWDGYGDWQLSWADYQKGSART